MFEFLKRNKKQNKRASETVAPEIRYVGAKKYTNVTSSERAMMNSIVYRSMNILSDSVASIPLDVYHKGKDDYWYIDSKNPLHRILTRKWNDRYNAYEALESLVIYAYLYGNAYVLIKRNADYEVTELVLLAPTSVYYNIQNNTYTVNDSYNKVQGTFTADKIIHIKNKSLSGYLGESTVRYAAMALGIANAADQEVMSILNAGGKLKGIVSSESALTGFGSAIDDQVSTIRDNMQAEIDSGKDIITLQSGSQFTPISQTVSDLKLIENKIQTASDIARFFGISMAKLNITTGGNYVASEMENLNFFLDTLQPLLCKIERAFNEKLISDSVASKYKIEFVRQTLPYYSEILKNYKTMLEMGIMSTNDVRKEINKTPVEGGDIIYISTNLQSISNPKVIGTDVDPSLETVKEETDTDTNKTE